MNFEGIGVTNIPDPNSKIHCFPFKKSTSSLINFPMLLWPAFMHCWKGSFQLRRYDSLDGLHAFKTGPLMFHIGLEKIE